MRKKLLAVLMTGAMVASFAGSATAVFAKSDDDNKLTVWAWDQNFNIKSMQIAADQYAKDHEGFSVDIVETSSDDCQTKLTTAANAGDYSTLPDIVLMQDNSYQKYLSALKGRATCIYTPTCSQYAIEAIEKHGVLKGGLLAAWRILRCNPFSKGGYDPVP